MRVIINAVSAARLLLFGWCLIANLALAEIPSYRPEVGRTYTYGIEMRMFPTHDRARPAQIRSRIQYRVTSVSSQGWTADYSTTPFGPSGPLGISQTSERHQPVRPLSSAIPASSMGFGAAPIPPIFAQMEEAARARAAQAQEQLAMYRQVYPGAYTHVSGRLKVSPEGRILEAAGRTSMPLLAGELFGIPLIRLPTDDAQTYSYKEVRPIGLSKAGSGPGGMQSSEVSLLTSLSRKPPASEELFSMRRDTELAGGQSAGVEIRASGEGECDFSLAQGMPVSGNLELQTQGINYKGLGSELNAGVSFALLNEWQQVLFDLYLLPSEQGLSPESLPRLTEKRNREVEQMLKKSSDDIITLNRDLLHFAPPPADSSLDNLVAQLASETPSVQRNPTNRNEMLRNNVCIQLNKRWHKMREAATRVPRTWSDSSKSFSVKAMLVGLAGTSVRLQRADNQQVINVPLERLCQEDREFVQTFAVKLSP